jgi:hypothetical protein
MKPGQYKLLRTILPIGAAIGALSIAGASQAQQPGGVRIADDGRSYYTHEELEERARLGAEERKKMASAVPPAGAPSDLQNQIGPGARVGNVTANGQGASNTIGMVSATGKKPNTVHLPRTRPLGPPR